MQIFPPFAGTGCRVVLGFSRRRHPVRTGGCRLRACVSRFAVYGNNRPSKGEVGCPSMWPTRKWLQALGLQPRIFLPNMRQSVQPSTIIQARPSFAAHSHVLASTSSRQTMMHHLSPTLVSSSIVLAPPHLDFKIV